jgi:replicative DNA helicase
MTTEAVPLSKIKAPPHSNEAEQSLLGAVMMRPGNYDRVADRITADMFYSGRHRMIWQAIDEIAREGMQTDPVTVGEWFRSQGKADKIENGAYLTMLANETPGSNALGWAKIIEDKHLRRRLIEAGTDITDAAWQHGGDPLEEAQQKLQELDRPTAGDAVPISAALSGWLEHIDKLQRGEVTKVNTGLVDVDRQIRWLMPADLMIVAGRPGTGKTIYGLQTAMHNARQGRPVLVLSLEMTLLQLVQRAIAGGGVESEKFYDPESLTHQDWRVIQEVMVDLKRMKNLLISDRPAQTINQIRVMARRHKRLHDISLLVVDYLQLAKSGKRPDSREQEVAEISGGLKSIGKELGIPVIALAQLNRDMEKRALGARRPVISDLRESGAIEQDADIIQMLYFNGQYDENDQSGILEVITRKYRNGPTGTSMVGYRPERFRMVNADLDEIGQYRREYLSGPPGGGGKKRPGFGLEDH